MVYVAISNSVPFLYIEIILSVLAVVYNGFCFRKSIGTKEEHKSFDVNVVILTVRCASGLVLLITFLIGTSTLENKSVIFESLGSANFVFESLFLCCILALNISLFRLIMELKNHGSGVHRKEQTKLVLIALMPYVVVTCAAKGVIKWLSNGKNDQVINQTVQGLHALLIEFPWIIVVISNMILGFNLIRALKQRCRFNSSQNFDTNAREIHSNLKKFAMLVFCQIVCFILPSIFVRFVEFITVHLSMVDNCPGMVRDAYWMVKMLLILLTPLSIGQSGIPTHLPLIMSMKRLRNKRKATVEPLKCERPPSTDAYICSPFSGTDAKRTQKTLDLFTTNTSFPSKLISIHATPLQSVIESPSKQSKFLNTKQYAPYFCSPLSEEVLDVPKSRRFGIV